MVRFSKCAVAALGFASAVAGPSVALAAGGPTSPLPESARQHQTAPAAAVAHTVKSVYETWGESLFTTLPASAFTPLDALTTIKCGPAAGCTVIAQLNAQALASADGTQWAICAQIDGNWANNGCYYQGYINTADGYKKANDRQNWRVATGTHTVQTFIYPTSSMTLNAHQNDYMIVTP